MCALRTVTCLNYTGLRQYALSMFHRGIVKSHFVRIPNFGNLKISLKKKAIFTRVGTLVVATIYLQLIQNRYMFRSFTVLPYSHQHCVQPVASDVEVVGYL